MPPAVEIRGRAAAPGIGGGPLFRIGQTVGRRGRIGDRDEERRALEDALKHAIAGVAALAERADGDGILDFQVAMLEDSALAEPAFVRIASGLDAAGAWAEALAVQIADYEAADSEYFKARASDMRDLRDRVLRILAGESDDVLPPGVVLTGEDVTPSRFLSVDWSRGGGIALFGGSPSSHVAMLARARGVPMVVGLGTVELAGHQSAMVDGDAGRIVLSPAADSMAESDAAHPA